MAQTLAATDSTTPIVFGPYKLMRRIGAGGMGEVYLAREHQAGEGRACVVKKVLPQLIENRAFVGRFLDEAKVVTRLNHPNIASVYAMGEVEGQYYLSMEYVQGKTVSRFMNRLRTRKQVMSPGLALLIGERMCEGLAYAHDAVDETGSPLHLVHRDLSPANVCISYRGEVKIIDFGAAQSTLKEEKTAPRVVIGNLTYMSPEQARKQFVDRRADVYSAAVVLWELFAWHLLPQKGDPVERWRKAASPNWMPPSTHRPDLPKDIDDALMKALRRIPDERYPDARAFGAELSRLRRARYPTITEATLGRMLTDMFAAEKKSEDELLDEIERGQTVIVDVTTDKSRPAFVPPTALAFEHRGVEVATDPGGEVMAEGPPRRDAEVTVSRVVFGSSVMDDEETQIRSPEVSLVREIEGANSVEGGGDYDTSEFVNGSTNRMVWVGVALFVTAVVIGFIAVLLLAGRS